MKEQIITRSVKLSNEILLGSVVELINTGKHVKINISGSSMKPFLHDGNTVLLGKISLVEIQIGDIILGRFNGNYVLHRVIRIGKDCVYLAGDNNLFQVERIESSDLYAIALALYVSEEQVSLTSFYSRYRGLVWYYLRPFRKLINKLFKVIIKSDEIKK